MMRTGSNGTSAPLGSGLRPAYVWLTIVVGIAAAGSAGCTTPGYRVTTRCYCIEKVERVLVISNVAVGLEPVFAHSLEHSMASALESNGIEAVVVTVTSPVSDVAANHAKEAEFAPDTTMRITVRPLYRTRVDGYPAIVGIDFEANVIDPATRNKTWQATGKVDYIEAFGPDYNAYSDIRREFAWNTTAAIVGKLVAEVKGQKPAPAYTVTEDRRHHGQRVD